MNAAYLYISELNKFTSTIQVVEWFIPWAKQHLEIENKAVFDLLKLNDRNDFINQLKRLPSVIVEKIESDTSKEIFLVSYDSWEVFSKTLNNLITPDFNFSQVNIAFNLKKTEIFEDGERLILSLRSSPSISRLNLEINYYYSSRFKERYHKITNYLGIELEPVGPIPSD